jgi:hypothetical protein
VHTTQHKKHIYFIDEWFSNICTRHSAAHSSRVDVVYSQRLTRRPSKKIDAEQHIIGHDKAGIHLKHTPTVETTPHRPLIDWTDSMGIIITITRNRGNETTIIPNNNNNSDLSVRFKPNPNPTIHIYLLYRC